MGRAPCCDKANVKKGPWSPEEDTKLKQYIENHGTGGNWIGLPQKAGLKRCGKSCRLRWLNYLRPNLKHGEFSEEEDRIICSLFANIGSRWSIIATQLPGRTDNDIKNYWNTKLKKKLLRVFPSQKKSTAFHSTYPLSSYPYQSLCSTMFEYCNFNNYTSPTVSIPGIEAISVPSNYSNATTCYLATNHTREVVQNQDVGLYSSMHVQYHPAAKESFFMFGNGGSTFSSSDGNCSQFSYGREVKQEDEMDHHQNFKIRNGVEESHNCMFGNGGSTFSSSDGSCSQFSYGGEVKQEDEMGHRQNFKIRNGVEESHNCMLNYGIGSPLDYYDPEVIKQLNITDTNTNNNSRLSSMFLS